MLDVLRAGDVIFSGVKMSVFSAGDVIFSVRPSPAVSSCPGGRCSSSTLLEPAPASPSPAVLSFRRRGRRRLVTSRPPPADPRLVHAAQSDPSGLPSLSQPIPSALCSPVRTGSCRPQPTPPPPPLPPPRADSALSQTLSGESPAAPRLSARSVALSVSWTDRHRHRPVSERIVNTRGCYSEPGLDSGCPMLRSVSLNGHVAEESFVKSTQKTSEIPQTNKILPDVLKQTASRPVAPFPVSSSDETSHTAKQSGLPPVLSPRKTNACSRSERMYLTSPHQKSAALPHPDVWRPERRLPSFSRHCSPVRLPACQSPDSACGQSVPSACRPPVLSTCGPLAAPSTVAARNSASYPYPWVISSEWYLDLVLLDLVPV